MKWWFIFFFFSLLFFLCLRSQFQTLPLLTCPIAKSITRPRSAGGCLRTTYLLITMCLNTAGGCKLKDKWLQDKKGGLCRCRRWLIDMWSKSELFDYNLLFFFSPGLGALASPRPRRMVRTVTSGGLQTGFTGPALWCVTWTLTACMPSECEAAGTPCSAPTALRSPSTHHPHLVSLTATVTVVLDGCVLWSILNL